MKRRITRNGGEKKPTTTAGKKRKKMECYGPTRHILTRLQAKKLHGYASPEKPPPATSSTKRRYEDPSSSSIWVPSSPDNDSDCHGTTSPSTYQSSGSVALNEDIDLEGSSAKTPPQVRAMLDALYESESQLAHEPVIPCPSSSSVIAPGFQSLDSSFRLASRNVQVEEPRRVERNETATDVFCPTSAAEKATLSPVFIEDRLGAHSRHPDQRDSSCPVIDPGFQSLDSSLKLASRDVQVQESRGVERNDTAANSLPRLWCATNRPSFLEPTGHEEHNLNASSPLSIQQQPVLATNETGATSDIAADRTKEDPWRTSLNVSHRTQTSAVVGNLLASATDRPIVMKNSATAGQSPTTRVAATEKAKLSSDFFGERFGACSGHTDKHDIPDPSSSPVIAPPFVSSDSGFGLVEGDVQVAEPKGVGRTETAVPQLWKDQLWRATNYRKKFSQPTGQEACNPNMPPSVDYLSASSTDKLVAVTVCSTPVVENAKLPSEFIEDRPGACSNIPDQHNDLGPMCSTGLTDFLNMADGQDCDEDDVESAALVPFEKYKVRPSSKATLDLIFQKYGDIAANLDLEMLENRSSVLDEVCEIIHSFRGKVLKDFPLFELRSKVDRLRHWKRSGLEIVWLLERLEGALEAKQHMSRALKDEWNANVEVVNRKKRELEEANHKIIFLETEERKMMVAKQALKQQTIKTKQELETAEAELKKTKAKVSKEKAKISPYNECPILDKLL